MRKQHRTIVGPSLPTRPLAPASLRASLPTVAAVAALLSFASPARALTSTKDSGVEQPENDAATDAEADAGDAAAYCPPPTVDHPIAGAMPPIRVHGNGCGCGGQSNDDTGVAFFAGAALIAVLRAARRSRE